ncbi:hypothetical protein GJ496_006067 [Pomphorhynchus laevis]|nr:hypothetical protein GJ496_006067 [Pomphorhynchus laevis]
MNVSLKELESIPSIADLQRQCDILSHELNKMSMELKSRDSVPQVSKEDMNRINKALDVAVKNWKARRAICKHMLDTLSESMNISVKELAEKVNSNIDEIIAIEKQFK